MTTPTAQTMLELADKEQYLFEAADIAYFKAGRSSNPQDWLEAGLLARQHRNALTAIRASQPAAQATETLYRQVITKDRIHYEAVSQAPAGTGGDVRDETKTVWLIEWPEDDNVPVRWWNPATGWMRDANKAAWFGRESDAADYISSGKWAAVVKPTEHKFLAALSPPQAPDAVREALEPFAKVFYDNAFWEPDDPITLDCSKVRFEQAGLKVGHFWKAAEVLTALVPPDAGRRG